MKQQNQTRALFDAVTDVDTEWIEEAAEPRTLHWSRPVLRIAAIAAVLALLLTALLWPTEENYVTGPGILIARAYALDEPMLSEENSTVLEEGITLPLSYNWCRAISSARGIPLHLSIDTVDFQEKNISFGITLSDGSFYQDLHTHVESMYDGVKQTYLGTSFRMDNHRHIYWYPTSLIFDNQNKKITHIPMSGNRAFADIVILADNQIIGYAVIEFYEVDGLSGEKGWYYNARMLKSVSFPQINGEFQSVSTSYINKQFQLIHETAQ